MPFNVKKIANSQTSNIKLLQNNTISMVKRAIYMGMIMNGYDNVKYLNVIKKKIFPTYKKCQ